MKVLLHTCCAPCSIVPLRSLRDETMEVTAYFFNHNIHPYQEYARRLEAVRQWSDLERVELQVRDEYLLEEFLGAVAAAPASRCGYCYASRLDSAAKAAAEGGFDAFSSSLLYSRYQKHDMIRKLGEEAGARHGVEFLYRDFRGGWQDGIKISKEMGLYRQQYCGCIYSEKERYLRGC